MTARIPSWQLLLTVLAVGLPVVPLAGLVAGHLDPAARPMFEGQGSTQWRELLIRPDGGAGPLSTSLLLALVVGAVAVPLGTLLAWVEHRAAFPGVRWLGVATLLPLAVPSYILAGTARHALGPGGPVGAALGLDAFVGFWAAALVLMVVTIPYVQLLVGGSLVRCPADESEAARTLGAGPWSTFRVAVLPRLRPAIGFSLLIVQLYVISDFGAVAVLDCQALTWRLYQAVDTARFDTAVQLGFGVVLLTIPLFVAARWIQGRGPAKGVANPRPAARHRLSTPFAALVFCVQAAVIGLGVLVPLGTLSAWTAEGIARGLPFAELATPLRHTATVAVVGATLTTLLALVPAWVAARGPRRASGWIEPGAYAASSLPGVLLAFGLLLAALRLARTTVGTDAYHWTLASGVLLYAAFATRFLAEAYAGLKTGVLLLDRRLEESARVLGASPVRRALRVVAPQLAPAGAVAFVLTLVAIAKELPITLLLGAPMGIRPLSARMYDRYSEALLHDAGVAGLVIVALGLSAFVFSGRWRQHV